MYMALASATTGSVGRLAAKLRVVVAIIERRSARLGGGDPPHRREEREVHRAALIRSDERGALGTNGMPYTRGRQRTLCRRR